MLKVLFCLAAVFAASTNAYAGVNCWTSGNSTTCTGDGQTVRCWTSGNYTTCN